MKKLQTSPPLEKVWYGTIPQLQLYAPAQFVNFSSTTKKAQRVCSGGLHATSVRTPAGKTTHARMDDSCLCETGPTPMTKHENHHHFADTRTRENEKRRKNEDDDKNKKSKKTELRSVLFRISAETRR